MLKFFFDRNNRHFLRLWLAQLISQFGDRIHQMALIGLITERSPGSALELAKILSFTIIPVFVVGPIAGVFVDRWDKRRTLFVCDLVRGLLVLLIPLVILDRSARMAPIYIVVFLIFCFSRFYVPAKMSIIPDLVFEEQLLLANSLMTTTGMIAFALGCALGGFVVDKLGARGGFLIDGGTFLLSALLIFSIRSDLRLHFSRSALVSRGREWIQIEKSVWREMREGWQYLWRDPDIRFVSTVLFILLAASGAVYVVIIIFVEQIFQSLTKLGILAVCLGVGLFLGAISYGRKGTNFEPYKTVFTSLIAGGILIFAFAGIVQVYQNLVVAALLSMTLGLVLGPVFIAANTIVHLVAAKEMRGKVFTSLEIVMHIAFMLAMLISAGLSEYIPRGTILAAVGVLFAVVGLWGYLVNKNRQGLVSRAGGMA